MTMGIPPEWEHKYAEHGNGSGNRKCDNANGNGYFFIPANNSHGFVDRFRSCVAYSCIVSSQRTSVQCSWSSAGKASYKLIARNLNSLLFLNSNV